MQKFFHVFFIVKKQFFEIIKGNYYQTRLEQST